MNETLTAQRIAPSQYAVNVQHIAPGQTFTVHGGTLTVISEPISIGFCETWAKVRETDGNTFGCYFVTDR